MKQDKIVKYFCKKCGRIFEIDIEKDETTTKVICAYCHRKMYKIKNENCKPNNISLE